MGFDGQNEKQGAVNEAGVAAQASGQERSFTQADVDRIVKERLARVKGADAALETGGAAKGGADEKGQVAALKKALAGAGVKAALAMAGVQPEKLERAVRLVDAADCAGADGMPDGDRIRLEVEALLRDFPELKAGGEAAGGGFKIGADAARGEDASRETSDAIGKIFGNRR